MQLDIIIQSKQRKYYIEYRGHGGTNETLDDSIDRLNPLSGFPKDDPIQAGLFLKYLGQDGRDRLRDALEYYKQEIVDVKQGAEFNKKVNQEIEKIISQLSKPPS